MPHFPLAPVIQDMQRVAAQLVRRSEFAGLQTDEIKKQIERHLQLLLLYKNGNFDFVAQIGSGNTLLVGEGNLSFALSLADMDGINPARLTATTFERESELSPTAQANGRQLRLMGAGVIYAVDATKLATTFGAWKFQNIVFLFPHSGSREPVEGHNPNFILVRDFLSSAADQLTRNGQALISAVDNPHYQGAFQFEEAAEIAGFLKPEVYPFAPDQFPGYEHTMTHQEGDALDHHEAFSTWVFRLP